MKKKTKDVFPPPPPPIKGFHAVKFFRKIKTRLSKKMLKMTDEELRHFLSSHSTLQDMLKK